MTSEQKSKSEDIMLRKGFDHPCRDTCSGWKQGYECGVLTAQDEVKALQEKLERAVEALNAILQTLHTPSPTEKDKWMVAKGRSIEFGKAVVQAREALRELEDTK